MPFDRVRARLPFPWLGYASEAAWVVVDACCGGDGTIRFAPGDSMLAQSTVQILEVGLGAGKETKKNENGR